MWCEYIVFTFTLNLDDLAKKKENEVEFGPLYPKPESDDSVIQKQKGEEMEKKQDDNTAPSFDGEFEETKKALARVEFGIRSVSIRDGQTSDKMSFDKRESCAGSLLTRAESAESKLTETIETNDKLVAEVKRLQGELKELNDFLSTKSNRGERMLKIRGVTTKRSTVGTGKDVGVVQFHPKGTRVCIINPEKRLSPTEVNTIRAGLDEKLRAADPGVHFIFLDGGLGSVGVYEVDLEPWHKKTDW